jgi:hypothetical protein
MFNNPTSEEFSTLEQALDNLSVNEELPKQVKTSQPKVILAPIESKNQRLDLMAYEMAHGSDLQTIAKKFSLNLDTVQFLVNNTDFVKRVQIIQSAENIPLERKVAQSASIAQDKRFSMMMTTKDEKILDSVTKDYLDRQLGKPIMRAEILTRDFTDTEDKDLQARLERLEAREKALESQRQALLTSSVDV